MFYGILQIVMLRWKFANIYFDTESIALGFYGAIFGKNQFYGNVVSLISGG